MRTPKFKPKQQTTKNNKNCIIIKQQNTKKNDRHIYSDEHRIDQIKSYYQ